MNKFMRKLRGAWRSRTVYFGLLLLLTGYAQEQREQITPLLPEGWQNWVWVVVGGVVWAVFAMWLHVMLFGVRPF